LGIALRKKDQLQKRKRLVEALFGSAHLLLIVMLVSLLATTAVSGGIVRRISRLA
jgi:hypothetical protein